ncbi:hypothetical protein BS78_01G110600 [Paspalum vaginatum]|nr:hypothetical protein BS78_01G110600 [Paspalum vaginatum]
MAVLLFPSPASSSLTTYHRACGSAGARCMASGAARRPGGPTATHDRSGPTISGHLMPSHTPDDLPQVVN